MLSLERIAVLRGRRLPGSPRRRLLGALALLLLLLLAVTQRDLIRRVVAESISVEFKHSLISTYSILTSPPLSTDYLAPIAYADLNPYGVNVFFEQEVEESKIRTSLQMIRDAGFGWIKQQVVWGEIETPFKGYYGKNGETWEKYDRIVDLANQYGVGVILRLDTSPDWARRWQTKLETPPDNYEDYGDFVYAVVSRYRGRVKYYQIWNEPNLAFEWGGQKPDPAAYARLLEVAYRRAKEADPNCVILTAALAPTIENSDTAWADLDYLQKMYDAGAGAYFDILSTNAYGLRSGPDDWRLDIERDMNFSRPILLRELMVKNGDSSKPIWAAEIGWNALPADFGEEPRYGAVPRDVQADYTARAYLRAQQEWPWMGAMVLWHFRMVNPADVIQQQYYFNIVGEDFSPYPVYDALKALATGPAVLYRGFHQETHWALSFDASWTKVAEPKAVLSGVALADKPGATLSFLFGGTSLDLVVPRGPDLGRIEVEIDGQPFAASELPVEHGQSYLDLYAPTEEWQVHVPVARGLSDSVHQATVRVSDSRNPGSSGGRVGIDGVIVDGPWPRDRLILRLVEIGMLGLGLGMTILRAARRLRARGLPQRQERPDEGGQTA